MKPDIILIGSGGHAKVVVDILEEMGNFNIIGITTVNQEPGSLFQGYPVLGDDTVLHEYRKKGIMFAAMGVGGFVSNKNRKKVFEKIKKLGFSFVSAIHPTAIVSKWAKIGEGVTIFAGSIISTEVTLGNNTIITTGSVIGHETIIEDHVLVSGGVTIGGNVLIKEGALIALGSKVVSGLTIGKNSLVAAGAVVTKNIGDNKRVFGVPAKEKPND